MIALLTKESRMASTPLPPKPRKQHGRQVWRTRWYDDHGQRHDHLFGDADEMSAREARAAYNAWLTTWTTQERVKNPTASAYTYTVAELASDYTDWARETYVKHGRLTSTAWNVAYAMQDLQDAYGPMVASQVEGPQIAALRDAMITGTRDGETYTRSVKTVNDRLFIVKQAFRWARERGFVSKENLFDIMQVKPLQAGRCPATAPREVTPIAQHWVAVTRRQCSSPIAAMIQIQWLTGCRPGDVCLMRPCDLNMGADVWLYTPAEHKMEHKNQRRIIPLGPQCQEIIRPFLNRPTDCYCFSPMEAMAERNRRNYDGTRRPGDRYSEAAYRRAIHYACLKSEKVAREKDPEAEVPEWNPNQLRHAAATRLNQQFGLEDVAVMLGHADMATTRIYALPDVSRAVEIARKVG